MPYLLDANVFIEAKNRHYGLDFCPAFWDWLIDRHAAKVVFSVDKVGKEICGGQDELAEWASVRGPGFFLKPPVPGMTAALGEVSRWATGKNYEPGAVSIFLSGADYFLVAHALAKNFTLVTHERASTSIKKIKIPDACHGVGVTYMTPFEMLRAEGARFHLGPPSQRSRPSPPTKRPSA